MKLSVIGIPEGEMPLGYTFRHGDYDWMIIDRFGTVATAEADYIHYAQIVHTP